MHKSDYRIRLTHFRQSEQRTSIQSTRLTERVSAVRPKETATQQVSTVRLKETATQQVSTVRQKNTRLAQIITAIILQNT